MRCPACDHNNRAERRFCAECGAALAAICAACGASNEPGEKFCGGCGVPVGSTTAADKPRAARGASIGTTAAVPPQDVPEGERKTVTVLFADIKGSMELIEDLDPEEARAIVDPALHLMMGAVHRYDGYVAQSTGDGIFALFGAPVAHEDHPQRALYAALRMQEELKRYSDRIRADGRLPIQVRVGVNTGEVVVRSIKTGEARTEYTPIGHSTSLAARMQVLAPIGSIATTEAVRQLCEGYFVLKDLGPTRVKGVSDPIRVYEVTGIGPLRTRLQRSAGRGLTKFVGRQHEMAALQHAADQAKSGHGQIVAAMAEAGVGKSRLFFEFKATARSGWRVLEAYSVSHGKASAYFPVIDLLHAYFTIPGDDDQRTRRAKVTGNVLTLDRSLEDTIPYLFALLGIVEGNDPHAGMDPQIRQRRTLEAIKRLLLRESLAQPLMLIFEDLHWIDAETQALLNQLADSIGTARILLLVNYRPEYTHAWGSKTHCTQLRLDPLGTDSAAEMLSGLLGDGEDLVPLRRLIVEKTEGNPFFMEETVQVLLDDGALVRNGTVKLTKPLNQLKIPPTVQAILAARIDRLPPAAKDLLQTLAVIGREFPLGLVRRLVSSGDDELNHMLAALQLGEFIYEQPASGDIEYTFKHALTQEVAYNSVLMERRKSLHERVGLALEELHANALDEYLEQLAHHYARSANAAKAVEYLRRAGEQAIGRSAYAQAEERAAAGLALLRDTGSGEPVQNEFALQYILARALSATRGIALPQVESAYARCLELAEHSGDRTALFSALIGLRVARMFALKPQESHRIAERMITLARESNDPGMLALAHFALANALFALGEVVRAREAAELTVEFCDRAGGGFQLSLGMLDVTSAIRGILGMILWTLGYPARALEMNREAESLSRGGTAFSLSIILRNSAETYLAVGDFGSALTAAERALRVSDENGFVFQGAVAMATHARALTGLGRVDEGVAEARRASDAVTSAGLVAYPRGVLFPLAEVELRAGHVDEALAALDQGLTRARETGAQEFDGEFLRLRGEALLAKDQADHRQAEECLRRAIDIARRQSAKSRELRATTSLARLLRNTGRRDEARVVLAEIYGWFTEGFDTRDLIDAKALLELPCARSHGCCN